MYTLQAWTYFTHDKYPSVQLLWCLHRTYLFFCRPERDFFIGTNEFQKENLDFPISIAVG
jgi:hypothetical protein